MNALQKTLISVLAIAAMAGALFVGLSYATRNRPPAQPGLAPAADTSPAKSIAETKPAEPAGSTPKIMYRCPMAAQHPALYDKPGECPICQMDLVPVVVGGETKPAAATSPGAADVGDRITVSITDEQRQLIGVKTALVERRPVTRTIRAAGRIEPNEKTLSAVTLKVSGWIEDLHVKAVGDTIAKGQPLATIYSPELYEAESNYLSALRNAAAAGASDTDPEMTKQSVDSLRDRLLLLDITPEQIAELAKQKEPPRLVTILSKTQGIVTERTAVQGGYTQAGEMLFRVADLSTVWIIGEVYEYEMPLIKTGMDVSVSFPSAPGERMAGKIDFVYPTLDDKTRTIRVRFAVPNPDNKLKPGMYATVDIAANLGEQTVIDDSAVLDTGLRQIVFIDLGDGRLQPRNVTVGERVDGQAIILNGLTPGERIVTSGNFLIDSESRMKAALMNAATPGMQMNSGQGNAEAGAAPETGAPPEHHHQ